MKILTTGLHHGKEPTAANGGGSAVIINTTGAVTAIDLQNPHPLDDSNSSGRYGLWNLSGKIRPSLKMLKSLKHLHLRFNTFNGIPFPGFFGSLKKL